MSEEKKKKESKTDQWLFGWMSFLSGAALAHLYRDGVSLEILWDTFMIGVLMGSVIVGVYAVAIGALLLVLVLAIIVVVPVAFFLDWKEKRDLGGE